MGDSRCLESSRDLLKFITLITMHFGVALSLPRRSFTQIGSREFIVRRTLAFEHMSFPLPIDSNECCYFEAQPSRVSEWLCRQY